MDRRCESAGDGSQAPYGQLVETSAEEDEELKLYALNSLMHVESERAIPVLDEFLAGDHSIELKEKALFVLSQSGSPRAREILVEIAEGPAAERAVDGSHRVPGLERGRGDGELLQQIYDSNQDPEVKAQALEAMMLGGHEDRVLAAARSEPDPELRTEAVELLGSWVRRRSCDNSTIRRARRRSRRDPGRDVHRR